MSVKWKSKVSSRKSAGVLLLIGVMAGVTVGGGVGVIAASSSKSVTVCADKTTDVLRYAKKGKCAKTETKVVLNQTGMNGTTGAKGDTGAAGTNGTAGAKGDTGTAGTNGTAGAKGDTGAAGAMGAAGASSPTGFTARSVCGSNGTTLCVVGEQGPGGGIILYVDSTNEMPGYDYLEVAPADATFALSAATGTWSTSTLKCGPAADVDCQASFLSDAGTAFSYIGIGTGRAATAVIVARHNAGTAVVKNLYAAGVADDYITSTASDWFLPSKVELNEVCKYARQQITGNTATVCANVGTIRTGVGGFTSGVYWSSSETGANSAWVQVFGNGTQGNYGKTNTVYVRPVRAF